VVELLLSKSEAQSSTTTTIGKKEWNEEGREEGKKGTELPE
jgi:hypothetical protein